MVAARVGVVLITWNRCAEALATVGRLDALPERPPVVVVDNGSTDGTAEALRAAYPDVTVLRLERNIGAAARTRGVEALDTPYVAFSDDDSWWAPGALAIAVAVLDAHPRVAVVTGKILAGPEERVDVISEEMAASPLPGRPGLPGAPLLSFLAGASVVRRDAYLGVGGFHPRLFIGGEEELMGADLADAGWELVYVPDVVVHHHASPRRDHQLRTVLGIRNTLWFTWLRRPLPSAARRTVALLRSFPVDATTVRGVGAALGGASWVLRHRRPVRPVVDRGLRLLEASQRFSNARSYRA